VLWCLAVAAWAGDGAVRLGANPWISLADGRSNVWVTAQVTDHAGRNVPDGTQIVFQTNLGSFRESVVPTINGMARASMTSNAAGTATITVSAFPTYRASATMTYEFVADRALLSTAREFVEIVAPTYLVYSPEYSTVVASGADYGVKVRYKDFELEADDVQVQLNTYEVKARKARVKFGKETREYQEVYFRLNQRRGIGLTTYVDRTPRVLDQAPYVFVDTEPRSRLGLVDVTSGGITPYQGAAPRTYFTFTDIGNAVTLVSAKKVVAYPGREIQFHRAELIVGGARVMRLPLFQLNASVNTPIVTDQFINVTNNQLAIDYPHYLSLKPGQTSLLRLRSGTRYGGGVGATRGTSLDYELRWNRGDEMDGGLTVNGLLRNDWGLGIRQFYKLDSRSTVNAQIDLPNHSGLFGTVNVGRQFDGWQANATANVGKTLSGLPYENKQIFFDVDKDPVKLGKLPVNMTYGLSASQIQWDSAASSQFQSSVGLRTRFHLTPITLGPTASIGGSLTVSHLVGHNVKQGLTTGLSTNFSTRLGPSSSVVLGYDYLDDGFNASILGRHRVTAQTYFNQGPISFRMLGSKSLDIDRLNASADLSFRFSPLWRIGTAYSLDRYSGSSFLDYSFVVGYRVGYREIGLSWSNRTKRIGFELLGATFN